ncbi:MAG: hypothetical protein P8171_18955 [Candidatus Thiodiazotropha sp.]
MENRVGLMALYVGPHTQGVSDNLDPLIDECVNRYRTRAQRAIWKITERFIENVFLTWQVQRIIDRRSEEDIA